jgi:hypothetical protein
MSPKGTTIQLEVRRRIAVSLQEAGWGVRHVARPDQCHHLIDLLSQRTRVHGFRSALWTLSRIATVIERHFGVTYCPSGV